MRRWSEVALGVWLAACVGCGTTSFSAGSGGDGGSSGDGSHARSDGGHGADAGPGDTGTARDAGTKDDAGTKKDGGGIKRSDAGADARKLVDAARPPPDAGGRSCPEMEPTNGGACPATDAALVCEYGSDPRFGCNPLYTCNAGTWVKGATGCAPFTSGTGCPEPWNPAATPGTPCTAMLSATCSYAPEADCVCDTILNETVGTLVCDVPDPTMAACPVPRPRAGATCSAFEQQCDYGACRPDGVELRCGSGGLWQPLPSVDFGCNDAGMVTGP